MNKPNEIRLAGEQAEVFDAQMDSDREWFEASRDWIRFRPEIEGEFNEHIMLGESPPYVSLYDMETGEGIDVSMGWVCVIDIGRAMSNEKDPPPSGVRTRFRCPPPVDGVVRQAIVDYAEKYVKSLPDLIGGGKPKNSKGLSRPRPKGFK